MEEESEKENFPEAHEKLELGFPFPPLSPPPPPPLDLTEVDKLVVELQNLWSKEDDATEVDKLVVELQNLGSKEDDANSWETVNLGSKEDDANSWETTGNIYITGSKEDDANSWEETGNLIGSKEDDANSWETGNAGSKEDDANSCETGSVRSEKKSRFHYPLRPGQPDCAFYMRTGTCKFGSNCKFNHPRSRRKNQAVKEKKEKEDKEEKQKDKKEKDENEKEDFYEREGQQECKYYLKAGGCKYGKACRYNHTRGNTGAEEVVDLNFLGLPIRPGKKECPFYMRTGSCKFAINCRFHHPDPTADLSLVNQNSTSLPIHPPPASLPLPTEWSLQRTSNESVPYTEVSLPPYQQMLSTVHGVHSNAEWSGHMGMASPPFPAETQVQASSASLVNDLMKKADNSTCQNQTTVEEFPERPGQPECQFYLKFGDCKFKSACRYHHPKDKVSKSTVGGLSPIGLPLRPDKNICAFYSRYGICKFGPSCKFDHPINSGPLAASATPASDQPSSLEKSTSEEAGMLTC